jgi:hypothetical protein
MGINWAFGDRWAETGFVVSRQHGGVGPWGWLAPCGVPHFHVSLFQVMGRGRHPVGTAMR